MSIFRVFNRHSRMQAQANAYADGELRGAELARFERHLASCAECRAAVESSQLVAATLRALPAATAPRSFVLTEAMVRGSTARPPLREPRGTPLYLGLARAGTAILVAAFVTVLALGSLSSSDGGGDDDSGAASRESAEQYAAPAAASDAAKDAAGGEAAVSTSSPALAPPSTGGATGSGFALTPVPPRTGAQTPGPGSEQSTSDSASPAAGGAAHGQAPPHQPGVETIGRATATAPNSNGSFNAVRWLGGLAGVAVLGLAALEVARRVRRG